MNVATKLSIAIAFLMIGAPAALGEPWSTSGNYEPNTAYDTSAWMWQEPAPAGETRIYFNAFPVILDAGTGLVGVSPNVGALQTGNEVPNSEYHIALFGVWIDCNGDGYVGMAEQGLREYPEELLLDDSICPSTNGNGQSWTVGAHNYNGWVSEYVPIAQDPASADQRVYKDDEAMVWGDYGRPDEPAFFRSCALFPQPRGTYQSTGGFLNYVECRTQQNGIDTYGNFNAAMDAIGDPLALRGEDGPEFDWRTTGLQTQTFGSEDTQYSPATIWDCDAEPTANVGETYNSTPLADVAPLGPEQTSITLYGIDPQPSGADPTTFTVPALVNHTEEGTQDCDTSNDAGHDFYGTQVGYVGETDFNGVSPNNKHEADWNMGFATASRGVVPFGPVFGTGAAGSSGGDAGALWTGGSGWYSPSLYLSKLGFRTIKVTLDDEEPTNSAVGFSKAWWLTFYAHVGTATTSRNFATTGGSGVYGAWQCGTNESGIHAGWNCDVNTWNKNPDGTPLPVNVAALAAPGQAYEFRDVDCYDGRVGDTGVGIQPAFYGLEPCF